jgi:hypothetical protein
MDPFSGPSERRSRSRSLAHDFRTRAHGYAAITKLNRLRGFDDRLETGTAQSVDAVRRRLLRDTRANRRNSCSIGIPGLGVNDVAEHDILDMSGVQPGAIEGCPDDLRRELTGSLGLQRTAKAADCGSRSLYQKDVRHVLTPKTVVTTTITY